MGADAWARMTNARCWIVRPFLKELKVTEAQMGRLETGTESQRTASLSASVEKTGGFNVSMPPRGPRKDWQS